MQDKIAKTLEVFFICECSSVVRMSPCQGEGRGFESHHSLKA